MLIQNIRRPTSLYYMFSRLAATLYNGWALVSVRVSMGVSSGGNMRCYLLQDLTTHRLELDATLAVLQNPPKKAA